MASVVFLSVAVPLAVIANSLVIEVVRRKRNKRKTNDMFILNLAVSDLLFGLFLTPDIYDLFVKSPPTLLYCKILPPFQTFTYFLSVYTLVSMAIERQYVILNPFKPRIRSRWLKIWLLMIWFSSLICVLPYTIVITAGKDSCTENWPSFSHRQVYTAALFVLQYPLPLLVILFSYVKIGIFLSRYRPPGDTNSKNPSGFRVIKERKANVKVSKLVAKIVILFALMNLPNQIAWMMLDFGNKEDQKNASLLMKVGAFTTAMHSFTNTIVYSTLTKRFRKDITSILCSQCICHCRKTQTSRKFVRPQKTANVEVQLRCFVNLGMEYNPS